MQAPEVPVNYFGKGVDYQLPDDVEAVEEFNRKYAEYERDNPDDPTGALLLEKYNVHLKVQKSIAHAPSMETKLPGLPIQFGDEILKTEVTARGETFIRLSLPVNAIENLKKFARYQRKRPRDVVLAWIELYCRL